MHYLNIDRLQAAFFLTLVLVVLSITSSSAQDAIDPQDSDDPNEVPEQVEDAINPATQVPDEIEATPKAVAKGRALFSQHCTACHAVEKQLIGPALASVHNRRPIPWLLAFIKNSQYVIQETDDEYAKHLFKEYKGQIMPNFEFLSNEDIYDILAYIKAESVSPTYTGGVNGIDSDVATRPQYEYEDDEAMADQSYNYDEENDLSGDYSFNSDQPDVASGSNFFAKISTPLLIVFGLVILAIGAIIFYLIKARRKLKQRENA